MSKLFIERDTLTSIADAIREKGDFEMPMTPASMADEIRNLSTGGNLCGIVINENGIYNAEELTEGEYNGYFEVEVDVPTGGGAELPTITITGDCEGTFKNGTWDVLVKDYPQMIKTENIDNAENMFSNSTVTKIPFDLNFKSGERVVLDYIFENCNKLTELPALKDLTIYSYGYIFTGCHNLRDIPENYFNDIDFSYIESLTGNNYLSGNSHSRSCEYCYSLRKPPLELLKHGGKKKGASPIYNGTFYNCYALDEVVDMPVIHLEDTFTSNYLGSTFTSCGRLKNLTFALQEDGTPYVVRWHTQTLDLSSYVGYLASVNYITGYNSGITADKQVKDDATYQALKEDVDWFTTDVAYSRYNHDSAVATINSLPDTSAYLATVSGKSNTIKFKGASGSATDGGAINTLTEEEIAVATAKGWTVSLV